MVEDVGLRDATEERQATLHAAQERAHGLTQRELEI
jgi:hypothetical protein